jgi:hypothetical protein
MYKHFNPRNIKCHSEATKPENPIQCTGDAKVCHTKHYNFTKMIYKNAFADRF